ncbi:small ligand-binding sensory domain FIST [Constrictibacter sp. MBR-5]|jgi:small ligand-binding sensory domain FIST|uniref:FIST signal transduction protein n=1 Tax=Constrictibacter sp. MBR-5 TaxID=3156467 RepID=UPI003391B4BF
MTSDASVTFRAGHAAGTAWQPVIRRCLDDLGRLPADANLGFVYVTDALANDMQRILDLLRQETGIADWVGTVGLGICAAGREYFDEPAASVMVAALPPDGFRLLPQRRGEDDEIAADLAQWIVKHKPALGLVHADPRNTELVELLGDTADRTGAYLIGGLTSSRGQMPQVATTVAQRGLSGVLFAADLPMAAGLSQGCSPIGPARTVTRSERNVIHTLDGDLALDALKEDLGVSDAGGLKRSIATIHVALPVPGSDGGDYLVRNLMGADPEAGAIAIGAAVDPGARVIFCRRDPDSAERDLRRMLRDVRSRLEGPPKGGIYVSCLARGPNMFGAGSRELGIVSEELGDFPLAGFFANGEISRNRLYGYTGVLALFV